MTKLLADKAIVSGWRCTVCGYLKTAANRATGGFGSLILPSAASIAREPDPLWVEVNAQIVFRSAAGPARADFHHKDSVAIVQGLAQGIFEFLRCEHSARCRDRMHQRDSSQLAQFLVELGVAMMGEHLANKNVQLRLHSQGF